jgi:hypothetical protein
MSDPDEVFRVKGERLLRYVREGTATQEQHDWLMSHGFLKRPKSQRPKFHPVSPVKKRRKRYKGKQPVVPVRYQPDKMGQSVLHVRTRAGGRNRKERRGP